MFSLFRKFLNANEREVKRLLPVVEAVNKLEPKIKKLKDGELAGKTEELKDKLRRRQGLEDILPEAFALVREASVRVNKERPFDVQIVAAAALHQGKIAEQKTGEGKTLTAAMPLYLNALAGEGAHLVTVNDYLARVGVGWMGPIYHLLGLSCAAIIHEESFIFDPQYLDSTAADWRLRHLRRISRREAYQADITYGINSEFGFDYLRDNMARETRDLVQRDFYYAIVDEVDSVLIDEARTPHIISAPDTEPTQKYYEYARLAEKLTPKLDFAVDEKLRTAHLTDHGIGKLESLLGTKDIYEKDFQTVHHLEAALKARTLYQREKDYIVRDNEVVIVDEFTGRLMPGRRWAEGIHQAVEAKEGVPIQQESKTLATISLQNYFRKYRKLAGMTGTAATESEEFHKIYKLEVVVVPTHRPMIRQDFADQVYKTQRAKYAAVVHDIEEAHRLGRPVLVGTTSIEKNEIIAQFLRHKGIPHQVLNAKQHEKEAAIIAQAGGRGAVTVATNMAGRGVDIILGGSTPKAEDGRPLMETAARRAWEKDHEEVLKLGGLHVIGTERHESRRIDNQLRGRSGRQGDPGSSRFFLALDDEIMRLFGGEQVSRLMTFFNLPEDQPLEHGMVSRAIEQAQSKVEQFNFDARKHLLEYDDVMNKQREIIYKMRRGILTTQGENTDQKTDQIIDNRHETKGRKIGNGKEETINASLKEEILEKVEKEIANIVAINSGQTQEGSGTEKIVEEFCTIIPFDEPSRQALTAHLSATNYQLLTTNLIKVARDVYARREADIGTNLMRLIEHQEMLRVIDTLWMEHLEAIDDLREGIGLRGYAQRDPLVEYKTEAFAMFERLIATVDSEIVHRIFKIAIATPAPPPPNTIIHNSHPAIHGRAKPGRNDPCWCGSGKKYKRCHYPN